MEKTGQKYGDEGKLVDSIMKDVKQIKKCDGMIVLPKVL